MNDQKGVAGEDSNGRKHLLDNNNNNNEDRRNGRKNNNNKTSKEEGQMQPLAGSIMVLIHGATAWTTEEIDSETMVEAMMVEEAFKEDASTEAMEATITTIASLITPLAPTIINLPQMEYLFLWSPLHKYIMLHPELVLADHLVTS